MHLPVGGLLDQILSQMIFANSPYLPRKVLFWGEGAGEVSSYIAGWMAGQKIDVVVLDGANCFNPYVVSSFAKSVSIPPEDLLRRIRIARAFTCYQMAALVGEKLITSLRQEEAVSHKHKPRVILLGPITTFLDEDVPERETKLLFERMLKKMEEMAIGGVSFYLFQPNPPFLRFTKRGLRGLTDSRGTYLTKKLFQLSDTAWKIYLDDDGPKMILEKGRELNTIGNCKLQNEKCKFESEGFKCLPLGR